MQPTRDEITQNVAERMCWAVARRDETRIARRLYRKQVVDGVYRLDDGAVLDDFWQVLRALGMMDLLTERHGPAIQREMVPFVQYSLRYGVKTRLGIERSKSVPAVLLSDAAVLRLVGFNAQQVRQGVCQRGATRQGAWAPGPVCPDTLAKHLVKLPVQDLEAVFHGAMRALATGGVLGKRVTGMAEGTDVETPAHDVGGGQVTRKVRSAAQRGEVHEIEVTVYGWKVRLVIAAVTKSPLAVTIGTIEAHEAHWTRAVVTPAQANLAGAARLHTVVCEKGLGAGTALWGLDAHDITLVVPATAHRAVTADARAQAMAQEGLTVGRRGHTVRHGPGKTAWTERQATDVVGIRGLTTDDQ